MNTKHWTPLLSAIFLAFGSAQATADSGWYYDEDSDTVIISFSGSPETSPASHSDDATVKHAGNWHYDADSDSIVFSVTGSRSQYIRNNPSIDASEINSDLAFLDQ